MKQISILMFFVLLPIFVGLGVIGWLPKPEILPLVTLGYLTGGTFLLWLVIYKFADRIVWATTRQVLLLIVSMALFLASALMLAVSWLPFPDFVWLMIFIPALVGMAFLLLWLLTTAFGSMDFSPYFIGGFILLSVLLDLTAWRIAYDPSTNTDEEIIITGGFQEGGP